MPETLIPYAALEHAIVPSLRRRGWRIIAACPHPSTAPVGVWGIVVASPIGVECWTIDGHTMRPIDGLAWRKAAHRLIC